MPSNARLLASSMVLDRLSTCLSGLPPGHLIVEPPDNLPCAIALIFNPVDCLQRGLRVAGDNESAGTAPK